MFELVTSIPYFVATKIAFAFAPAPIEAERLHVSTLAGLQNSVIINPTNQASVELRIPFVSTMNWAPVDLSVGTIVARLLEPVVTSFPLTNGIPWTLLVSVDPANFQFRYVVPPHLPNSSEPSVTNLPSLGEQMLAESMSTKRARMDGDTRTAVEWPLVQQPQPSLRLKYESMLLIPRSRVEFVQQKVRGQFPTGYLGKEAVANMFDIPAFTLESYRNVVIPNIYSMYPYLTQRFLVNAWYNDEPSEKDANVPVWYSWRSAHGHDLWLQAPSNEGLPSQQKAAFTFRSIQFSPTAEFDYYGKEDLDGVTYHHFYADISAASDALIKANWTACSMALACWVPSDTFVAALVDMLGQIDSCPAEVTHLALYTTMPPNVAAEFNAWLITADNTSPPMRAMSHCISFSPNQSALAYNAGRFAPQSSSRGIIWKLFKLFKGDETKWWAWLVKGLDIVVDALVGAFLGRSSVPYVVPIGAGSGFRVEAVGDYDPKLLTTQELAPLEYIPPSVTPSLTQFMMAKDAKLSKQHHFRRRRSSQKGFSDNQEQNTLPAASSVEHELDGGPSILTLPGSSATPAPSRPSTLSPPTSLSRLRSRRQQARHPSRGSKKRLFRGLHL